MYWLSLPASSTQHLDSMQAAHDMYGQALALSNIAKTYEYMANLSKACETLESVRIFIPTKTQG